MTSLSSRYGAATARVIFAFEDAGPMTSHELAKYLDVSQQYAAAVISRLVRPSEKPPGPKRLYVSCYVFDAESSRRYPRAVYSLGSKEDARKPRPNRAEVKARYLRGVKSRAINSVFALGMTERQLGLR